MWARMGRAIFGTVVALTLALAGCGGEDEADPPATAQPKLPAELAVALAAQSDQIADNLAAGDECAADLQAQALRAQVEDAVGGPEVPPALGREMSAAAGTLDDGIQCEPAPAPAPEPKPKPKPKPVATPNPCEQLEAQLEQAEEQEEAAHGPDKKAAKDLKKQLEEQLRFQCEEHQGGGSDEFVPPGHQDGGPGNGRGNGGGGED